MEPACDNGVLQIPHKKGRCAVDEGIITFLLTDGQSDWSTNARRYDFGLFAHGDVSVGAVKHPDGTLELNVAGVASEPMALKQRIPPSNHRGLRVAIAWTRSRATLYLKGRPVQTVDLH